MELDELKQELKKYKDLRDKAINEGTEFGWINEIIADYEQKIAALESVEEEQAAPVEIEVKLPVDYNLVFGNPNANVEISNLIRQTMVQLNADHTGELDRIFESHKQKMSELQEDHEIRIRAVTKEKLDAESKRDAAVVDKEAAEALSTKLMQENNGLKEQIDELEGLLRTYKKPVALHGLSLTTTLQPETDEEKQARLAKEKADLLNRNLSRFNIDPLPTKDELVTSQQLDESFRSVAASETVVSGDSAGDRVPPAAEIVDQAEDGSAKNTIQRLTEDVDLLKTQMDKVLNHLFN